MFGNLLYFLVNHALPSSTVGPLELESDTISSTVGRVRALTLRAAAKRWLRSEEGGRKEEGRKCNDSSSDLAMVYD